jgi:hypothetical protein
VPFLFAKKSEKQERKTKIEQQFFSELQVDTFHRQCFKLLDKISKVNDLATHACARCSRVTVLSLSNANNVGQSSFINDSTENMKIKLISSFLSALVS